MPSQPERRRYCACSRADVMHKRWRDICPLHGSTPEAKAYQDGSADGASTVRALAREALGALAEHEMLGKSVPAEADHDCRLIVRPPGGCGCTRIVVGCTGCDWVTTPDGTQGDAHRGHVVAVVLAALEHKGQK